MTITARIPHKFSLLYQGGLKSSYDDVISAVDDFFTNGIQALQHQWKKYVDLEKRPHLATLHEII